MKQQLVAWPPLTLFRCLLAYIPPFFLLLYLSVISDLFIYDLTHIKKCKKLLLAGETS